MQAIDCGRGKIVSGLQNPSHASLESEKETTTSHNAVAYRNWGLFAPTACALRMAAIAQNVSFGMSHVPYQRCQRSDC
jgi:hypothetical protein